MFIITRVEICSNFSINTPIQTVLFAVHRNELFINFLWQTFFSSFSSRLFPLLSLWFLSCTWPDIVIKTCESEYHITTCTHFGTHTLVVVYKIWWLVGIWWPLATGLIKKAFCHRFNQFIHNQSPWNTFQSHSVLLCSQFMHLTRFKVELSKSKDDYGKNIHGGKKRCSFTIEMILYIYQNHLFHLDDIWRRT